MMDARTEIQEIVDRETRAWDTQDVDQLLSIFHPDMVWPWPRDRDAHDPLDWVIGMGRFDRARWRTMYLGLFATHRLVHNHRITRKIELSPEQDGAFAVVDVDTLWHRIDDTPFHWLGRACKIYSRVGSDWKLIAHTGLLAYS